MTLDSLYAATLFESLRAFIPDSVVVSRVDTVAVMHSTWPGSPWWVTALQLGLPTAAIAAGWIVTHNRTLAAQERRFHDEVLHEAWRNVAVSIDEYIRSTQELAFLMEYFPNDFADGIELLSKHSSDPAGDRWWTEIRIHDLFFSGLLTEATELRVRQVNLAAKTERLIVDSKGTLRSGVPSKSQVLTALNLVSEELYQLSSDVDGFRLQWQARIYNGILRGLLEKPVTEPGPKERSRTNDNETK